jgi:beta-glucosidase
LHDTRRPENVRYLVSSGLRYDGIRIGAQPAYDADQAILDAVKLAKEVDTVILSVGLNQDWESEGDDRPTLHLPMRTDELVFKVAEANPNTIVVIQGGSAVAMPWLDKVKGVVQAWYGGGEAGTGIADIVYGHVNPSGRLPLTFPNRNLDNPAALSFKSFNGKTYYEEGIWVGYRHYNAREIQPLFPFGFGLSYTTFDYENLQITSVSPKGTKAGEWKLRAKVTVKNTGPITGNHSVHFYLSPPPETATGLKHPEYTLQAFTKVYDLAAGESQTVEVDMDKCEYHRSGSADDRCNLALGRVMERLACRAWYLDCEDWPRCADLLRGRDV